MSEKQVDRNLEETIKRTDYALSRTQLANQRTFLAWIRTSLALIGFGFGLAKFVFFVNSDGITAESIVTGSYISISVGLLLILVGLAIVVLAYIRYRVIRNQFGSVKDPYNWLVLIIVLCIALAGVIAMYDLLFD